MAMEKASALVIRMADFSESSRVVTLYTNRFGKVSALAKGAKRLKGPFEASLDLLAQCEVVFLKKTSGALDLLTEAKLAKRFTAGATSLQKLYGGYYIAELLDALTEPDDPHPELFFVACDILGKLGDEGAHQATLLTLFELSILNSMGQLPLWEGCVQCGEVVVQESYSFSIGRGGIVCQSCAEGLELSRRVSHRTVQSVSELLESDGSSPIPPQVLPEIRSIQKGVMEHVLGRKSKILPLLSWK